jgi:hypothetical protein
MFVSATGDDSNPCTRTQPCRTFQSTQFSVFSAGEMDALDSGDFGNVQLDRPITIDGGSGAATIALHSGNSCPTPAEAICIDIPFGTVIIRNLTLGGGITVTSADFVRVEHVIITASLGIGYNAKLGNHSLDDLKIEGAKTIGVAVNGAGVKLSISNSVLSRSPYGLAVFNGGLAQVDNCLINLNTAGVSTSGGITTAGTIRISNSTITDNTLGLDTTGTGASLISFTNNHIFGNTTNGNPTLSTTQR